MMEREQILPAFTICMSPKNLLHDVSQVCWDWAMYHVLAQCANFMYCICLHYSSRDNFLADISKTNL